MRWTRARFDGPLLLLLYGALAVALFGAAWTDPLSRVVGGGPDPPVFMWYLRWIPFAISHGMNPLFTNYLDYPDGINLMWQTSIPLLGLLLWPVTATVGPVFSYNLLITASVTLSAFCGYVACRRHVSQGWAAALGGLLFGFSPYALAQSLGHPHVGFTAICPLMLIAFEEAVIRQARVPWKLGLAVGGLSTIQLLISEELLLTQALMAVLAIAMVCGLRPGLIGNRIRYAGKVVGTAAGVLAVVGAIPLWFQFFGPQSVHGTLPASNVFVSDVAGFVLPTSLQFMAPPALTALTDRFAGTQYEGVAYVGIPMLLLLIVGTVRWWRLPLVQVASMLVLLTATLTLGVTLHVGGLATGVPAALAAVVFLPLVRARAGRVLPVLLALTWLGLAAVPMLNNVVPSRLMVYVFLLIALLVSVFADRWSTESFIPSPPEARRWVRRLWNFRAVGVATVLALSLLPRVPFPASPVGVPSFFAAKARVLPEGSVTLLIPFAHDFESRAMLWQLSSDMRFRMPDGYANRPGPSLDPRETALGNALIAIQEGGPAPTVAADVRATALETLREWEIQTVVVGPMNGQDRIVSFLTDVIGIPPAKEDGVFIWRLTGSSAPPGLGEWLRSPDSNREPSR